MPNHQLRLDIPARMVFIMWLVFSIDFFTPLNLKVFGIIPREPIGLIGIFTSPFLHGNVSHITANTIPVLLLGGTLFFFYPRIATRVFYIGFFLTNILVWMFASKNIHIGASGLVYALASFLIFYGFYKKDFKSLFISIIMIFLYGGLVYGVLPGQPGVSWESHLFGGIAGAILATAYGRKKGNAYA